MKKLKSFLSSAGTEQTFKIEEPVSALLFYDLSETIDAVNNVYPHTQAKKFNITAKLNLPNQDAITIIDNMTLYDLALANAPFGNPILKNEDIGNGDIRGLSLIKLTNFGSILLSEKAYIEVTLKSTFANAAFDVFGMYSPQVSKEYLSYDRVSKDGDNDIKMSVLNNTHMIVDNKHIASITRNYGNGNSDTLDTKLLNFYQAAKGVVHLVSSSGDVIDPEYHQDLTIIPLVNDNINVKNVVFDAVTNTTITLVRSNQYLR